MDNKNLDTKTPPVDWRQNSEPPSYQSQPPGRIQYPAVHTQHLSSDRSYAGRVQAPLPYFSSAQQPTYASTWEADHTHIPFDVYNDGTTGSHPAHGSQGLPTFSHPILHLHGYHGHGLVDSGESVRPTSENWYNREEVSGSNSVFQDAPNASIQASGSLGTQVLVAVAHGNHLGLAEFSLEIPFTAAAVILEKGADLKSHARKFLPEEECWFDAGYNSATQAYSLILKADEEILQGDQEILWISFKPERTSDRECVLRRVKSQFLLAKAVAENVFHLVGIVDESLDTLLVYDAKVMRTTEADWLVLLQPNIERLMELVDLSAQVQATAGEESTTNSHMSPSSSGCESSGVTNSSGTGGTRFTPSDNGHGPRETNAQGPSVQPRPPSRPINDRKRFPFYCHADFFGIGVDHSQRVYILLDLEINTLTSQPRSESSRTLCRVTAAQVEGGILPNNNRAFLSLEQLQLDMLPILDEATDEQMRLRKIIVHDPDPIWRTLDSSESRSATLSLQVGMPSGISLKGDLNWGDTTTKLAQLKGLGKVQTRCLAGNHFQWIYPVIPGKQFDLAIDRGSHSVTFNYVTQSRPDSIQVEASFKYRLPGRKPLVRDQRSKYPCRDVKFKLTVKLLPDNENLFDYPRDEFSGMVLDLGEYKFVGDDQGDVVLDVRRGGYRHRIKEPHLPSADSAVRARHLNWTASQNPCSRTSENAGESSAAQWKMRESNADGTACSGTTELSFTIPNPKERGKSKRKKNGRRSQGRQRNESAP